MIAYEPPWTNELNRLGICEFIRVSAKDLGGKGHLADPSRLAGEAYFTAYELRI